MMKIVVIMDSVKFGRVVYNINHFSREQRSWVQEQVTQMDRPITYQAAKSTEHAVSKEWEGKGIVSALEALGFDVYIAPGKCEKEVTIGLLPIETDKALSASIQAARYPEPLLPVLKRTLKDYGAQFQQLADMAGFMSRQ